MGAAAGVQLEHLGQIHPGPHDRAGELDAIEHGLKDRQPHLGGGGRPAQQQPPPPAPAAPPGRSDRNACSKAAGAAASTIAASAPPNPWRVAAGSSARASMAESAPSRLASRTLSATRW